MGARTDPRFAIDLDDVDRLHYCTHHDPHSIYDAHIADDDTVVHTRVFDTQAATIVSTRGEFEVGNLGDGLFTAFVPGGDDFDRYPRITWSSGGTVECADDYHFLPTIGADSLRLIGERRHGELQKVLDTHLRGYDAKLGTVEGTSFTV